MINADYIERVLSTIDHDRIINVQNIYDLPNPQRQELFNAMYEEGVYEIIEHASTKSKDEFLRIICENISWLYSDTSEIHELNDKRKERIKNQMFSEVKDYFDYLFNKDYISYVNDCIADYVESVQELKDNPNVYAYYGVNRKDFF